MKVKSQSRTWSVLLFVLLLAAFFVVQWMTLDVFGRDYDEGVYLAQSHLVSEGYALYNPVDSPLPPFFIWWLAAIFALLGTPSVLMARIAVVISGMLGLLSIAWISKQLLDDKEQANPLPFVAAFSAAALLALFPRWALYGQVAMADVPSLSFSLLAIALALKGWADERGRRWVFWGGVAAGVGMGIKFLAAYTAPVLALVVVLSYRASRPFTLWRFIQDGTATLAGFLLPLLLSLFFIDVERAYETVFQFHWESAADWVDRPAALRLMATFHWEHVGWLLLALLGLFYLIQQRKWRILALLIGWELLVVVMLIEHAPLWGHLLLPLASPVIIAGGIALAEGVDALTQRAWRVASLPVVALLLFLLLWPRALTTDKASTVPIPDDEAALLYSEVIPWLQDTVAEDEFVLTDSPMIATRAHRLVLPDKTDTSFTKLFSGFLTAEDLIHAAETQQPAAIIFWTDRFRSQDAWSAWVQEHYVIGYEKNETRRIFVRPDLVRR